MGADKSSWSSRFCQQYKVKFSQKLVPRVDSNKWNQHFASSLEIVHLERRWKIQSIPYPKYLHISWTSELHEKGKIASTAAPGKQGHHNMVGMPIEITYEITGYIILKIFEICVWYLVHILDENNVNAKVLYGIFKTNNLFLNRKCQKMFLKSHFQFFQSRELWNFVH